MGGEDKEILSGSPSIECKKMSDINRKAFANLFRRSGEYNRATMMTQVEDFYLEFSGYTAEDRQDIVNTLFGNLFENYKEGYIKQGEEFYINELYINLEAINKNFTFFITKGNLDKEETLELFNQAITNTNETLSDSKKGFSQIPPLPQD